MDATEEKPIRKRATRRKAVEPEAIEAAQETAATTEVTNNPALSDTTNGSDNDHGDDNTSAGFADGDEVTDDLNGGQESDLLDADYDDADLEGDEDHDALHDDEYEEDYTEADDTDDAEENSVARLTHLDEDGRAQMVDVSAKPITARSAIATGFVRMAKRTLDLLENQSLPKGDALTVAEVAGIMAAKRTSDLIPLCHPLALTNVAVHCEVTPSGVHIRAEAATQAQTGVEMEALAAASIAALTLYDMCKGVDPNIVISDVRLNSKSGGATGEWRAAPAAETPAPALAAEETDYLADDLEEEEEEQIVPRSIPQPEVNRPAYRRDSWSGAGSGAGATRPPARPYDREGDARGGYGNRPGYGGGYNRSGSSYGNRPQGGPTSGPTGGRPGPTGGYPANRDRGAGGFNRDRGTSGGYTGNNRPGYGYSGYNRDRNTPYGNRQDNRPDNRTDNRPDNRTDNRPGYGPNRDRTPGGYQGGFRPGGAGGYNRERGSTGYNPTNRSGFAGFRDRNRDRENE